MKILTTGFIAVVMCLTSSQQVESSDIQQVNIRNTELLILDDNTPSTRIITEEDVEWLALNIYHEARSESLEGQVAIALVTINRVLDKRFPSTVKGVVTQARYHANGQPKRNRCQFSWWCDGKSDEPKNLESWERAKKIALTILLEYDNIVDITRGATHYHADYVHPRWATQKRFITSIGTHKFYRWEYS